MKKYIPYSKMSRKCNIDGTKKKVKNLYTNSPSHFLICTKYWVCCNSGACRKERGLDEKLHS
jgi:hypothetical protein